MVKSLRPIAFGALLLCAGNVVGCASSAPPREVDRAVAQARLAVESLDQPGTQYYAPLESKLARENLAAAEAALDEEDYDRARRLAEKAVANAEVAEAKTEEGRLEAAETELSEALDTLRQELPSQ